MHVNSDIKPENFVYASPLYDSPLKLVDFGLSKTLGFESNNIKHTVCGTPAYAAPEVIKCTVNQNPQSYDVGCDVWSCGVILYCLLSGQHPFDQDAGLPRLFEQIIHGRFSFCSATWGHITNEAKLLVMAMMKVEPQQRITASESLRAAWLNKFYDGETSNQRLTLTHINLKEQAEIAARRKLFGARGNSEMARGDKSPLSVTALELPVDQPTTMLGCVLAHGEELEIAYINSHAKALLACPGDPNPCPRFVRDLLEAGMEAPHAQYMAQMMRDGKMPSSLQHPLRMIKLRRTDGSYLTVNLLVGILGMGDNELQLRAGRQEVFYAYFYPPKNSGTATPSESVRNRMEEIYGCRVAEAFLRGEAFPAPESHNEVTVACCSILGLEGGAGGEPMKGGGGGHGTGRTRGRGGKNFELLVQEVARRCHLRLCRLRQNCLVVMAGSNWRSHDLVYDQVTRTMTFLRELSDSLEPSLSLRAGVATGPMHVAWPGEDDCKNLKTWAVDASDQESPVPLPLLCRPGPGSSWPGGAEPGEFSRPVCVMSGPALTAAEGEEKRGEFGWLYLTDTCAERLCRERGLALRLPVTGPIRVGRWLLCRPPGVEDVFAACNCLQRPRGIADLCSGAWSLRWARVVMMFVAAAWSALLSHLS